MLASGSGGATRSRVDSDHEVAAPPAPGRRSLFIDTDAIKARIVEASFEEPYDVTNFYHKAGVWRSIACDPIFEKMTLAVISINALWISIDTDWNEADTLLDAQPVFQIAEHSFCVYFAFEWTSRFLAFRRKRDGLRDGWFVFDSTLVFMMVVETWVMSIVMLAASGGGGGGGLGNASILRMARLLRLSRMARMARLFREMPELLILIKGMAAACRSVIFTMVLLIIILYIFGIALTQLVGKVVVNDYGETPYGTVPSAMMTLLASSTLYDGVGEQVKALGDKSILFALTFYICLLFCGVTVMNMLIGVLCEVIGAVARSEKESLTISFVKSNLLHLMDVSNLDEDQNGTISRQEFMRLLELPPAVKILAELGVDVISLVDYVDFIFPLDQAEITFRAFMEQVLLMRGVNTATVKDMIDLRFFIKRQDSEFRQSMRPAKTPRRVGLPQWENSGSEPSLDLEECFSCGAPLRACTCGTDGMDSPALSETSKSRSVYLSTASGVDTEIAMDEALEVVRPSPMHSDLFQAPAPPDQWGAFAPEPPEGAPPWEYCIVADLAETTSWGYGQTKELVPEEAEMYYRKARLMHALVEVQIALLRFLESLTAPSDLASAAFKYSRETGREFPASLGTLCTQMATQEYRFVQGELMQLHQAVVVGMCGLERTCDRTYHSPAEEHIADDLPCVQGRPLF